MKDECAWRTFLRQRPFPPGVFRRSLSRYDGGMALLSFLQHRRHKRAEALYREGQESIEARAYEGALEIARKLRKIGFSGAFEVEALAYSGLGRTEAAVRVLREGLALAPGAWPNWILLGNCLSDLEQYDDALAAYGRAGECPGADRSSIALNLAIVHIRRGHHEAALRRLDEVTDDEDLDLRAGECRMECLWRLGREQEAEALGERILRDWQTGSREEEDEGIGRVALTLGELRRERGDEPETLRAQAIEDWRWTRYVRLLWLIRDLRPDRSAAARRFRIFVHATLLSDASAAARGYYMSAEVVADSPEEAFAYLKELDPPEAGTMLALDKFTAHEACPDQPKGVYSLQGRVYYRETE